MTVQDVCSAVDALAPPGLAFEGDRIGLLIGSPNAQVTRVLVTLTVDRQAFQKAHRLGAELIVAHHPIIYQPLAALRTDDPDTRLCLDLANAGIACFAAHTNLDVAPGGVNTVLAERLGLTDTSPLLPAPGANQVKLVTFVPESHLPAVRTAICEHGAGVIGDYTHCTFSAPGVGTFLPGEKARPFSGGKCAVNEEPEQRFEVLVTRARLSEVLAALKQAHPYEEVAHDIVQLENRDPDIGLGRRAVLPRATTLGAFARHVQAALKVPHVRMVGPSKQRVKAVGVLGGAGGSEVHAMPGGLDVLVTGDLGYHDALAAQSRGLGVVDAGHSGTEKWVVPGLAKYLRGKFKKLRVSTHVERDVFHAVQGRPGRGRA